MGFQGEGDHEGLIERYKARIVAKGSLRDIRASFQFRVNPDHPEHRGAAQVDYPPDGCQDSVLQRNA